MTVLLAAAALTLGTPTPPAVLPFQDHPDHKEVVITCGQQCRAWRACNHGSTRACIRRAALKYRVDEGMLSRKAWCESRLNPAAYNPGSGAAGLFQFLGSTWRTTPYGRRSVWSAKWNALAAGWMHARGRGGEWSCQ